MRNATEPKQDIDAAQGLLAGAWVFALLPWMIFAILVSQDLPLTGGVFLNPANICAYFWVLVAVAYFRRTQKAWIFVQAPLAFAVPFWFLLFWMWGQSGSR